MDRIYLDYAATTPLDPEVISIMVPLLEEFANPSSIHTSGRAARRKINDARRQVTKIIHASPEEIVFTGGGTESDNLAIIGTARAYKNQGKHIIVSAVEHKAVLEPARMLEKEGFIVSIAPVDSYGQINVEGVLSMIREDTTLISIMLGNNEIGTLQPIQELAEKLKKRKNATHLPYLHTDACQVVNYQEINVEQLGVDLLTFSGSKIYGPKGVGVLYVRNGVIIEPVIVGGGQEYGYRAGTESLPHIAGLAKALECSREVFESEVQRISTLRTYLITELQKNIPEIIINGHPTDVLPHIVHVTIPNIEGESMVLMLDEAGIEVATGSACSSKDLLPSHVLRAIGQNEELIHGSVRFSLGRHTTKENLDAVVTEFSNIIEKLKNMSALTSSQYGKAK